MTMWRSLGGKSAASKGTEAVSDEPSGVRVKEKNGANGGSGGGGKGEVDWRVPRRFALILGFAVLSVSTCGSFGRDDGF